MRAPYRISVVLFPDGERLPMLVDGASGVPLIDPNSFAVSQLRNGAKAANTIEVALRAISVLLAFGAQRHIDITARIHSGELLSPGELDLLMEAARSRFEHLLCPVLQTPAAMLARRYPSTDLEKLRFPIPVDESPLVSGKSARIRAHYILKYLRWLADNRLHQLKGSVEYLPYKAASDHLFKGLETRMPPKERGYSAVVGLTLEAETALAMLVSLDCAENPWRDPDVRIRNQLLIQVLLLLGPRGGEARGLRIPDINFREGIIKIRRRRHPPDDPSRRPALTKTLPRDVPAERSLLAALHFYITEVRRHLPNSHLHDVLFTAHPSGAPLSKSALAKIIKPLSFHPRIGERVTPHVLRHTWNDRDAEACDAAGVDESLARRTREFLQGWVRGSPSSDLYTRRRIEAAALEGQRRLQKAMVGRFA